MESKNAFFRGSFDKIIYPCTSNWILTPPNKSIGCTQNPLTPPKTNTANALSTSTSSFQIGYSHGFRILGLRKNSTFLVFVRYLDVPRCMCDASVIAQATGIEARGTGTTTPWECGTRNFAPRAGDTPLICVLTNWYKVGSYNRYKWSFRDPWNKRVSGDIGRPYMLSHSITGFWAHLVSYVYEFRRRGNRWWIRNLQPTEIPETSMKFWMLGSFGCFQK